MPTRNLLYKKELKINDWLSVPIPTVREVLDDEDGYFGIVSTIIATPYDMMVQLDDVGIDYTEIDDYELFLLYFETFKEEDTHLIFGNIDLKKFKRQINLQNNTVVLRDNETGHTIDKSIHWKLCQALRDIHRLERNHRKPGNEAAKKYLLERAKIKMRRRKNKIEDSHTEALIVSMVNTEQFKYKFDEVLDLSIYQFNVSVKQVNHKIDFDNRMHGVYAGTVSVKDINPDDLSWISRKL